MRAQGPVQKPVWPGMSGGRYKPLTDHEVERIHQSSLDLLENVGIADPTEAWRDRVLEAGGWMKKDNRLCFPRALVRRANASKAQGLDVCVAVISLSLASEGG